MPLPLMAIGLGIKGLQLLNSATGASYQNELLAEADDKRNEAKEKQRQGQAVQHRQAVRNKNRQARIIAARIQSQAANSGVTGSSGESGALASLNSSTATNLGALDASKARAEEVGGLLQSASDLNLEAAVGQQKVAQRNAMIGVAGSLFNQLGSGGGTPSFVDPNANTIITPSST